VSHNQEYNIYSPTMIFKKFVDLKMTKIISFACLLSSLPLLYTLFSGNTMHTNTISIPFVLWIFFILLPFCFEGSMRLVTSILVSVFYFVYNLSYFSFGAALSSGAYASIMESNAQESIGYIQSFAMAPLFFLSFFRLFMLFF